MSQGCRTRLIWGENFDFICFFLSLAAPCFDGFPCLLADASCLFNASEISSTRSGSRSVQKLYFTMQWKSCYENNVFFADSSFLTILFWLVATYIPSWLRISPQEVKSASPWTSMKKYCAGFGIFWYALFRHPYRCWNSNVALNGCFFISATMSDWILGVSGSLSLHDWNRNNSQVQKTQLLLPSSDR